MTFKTVPGTEPKRGRPPKLVLTEDNSVEIADKFAEYLQKGMFVREACALVGVSSASVYHWLKLGIRDSDKGIDSAYSYFSDTIKRAMAEAEMNALENIQLAGANPAFWAANAWYLERRYPKRYGKQDRTTVTHEGNLGIPLITEKLSERVTDNDKLEVSKQLAGNLAKLGNPRSRDSRGANGSSDSGDELEGILSEAFGDIE